MFLVSHALRIRLIDPLLCHEDPAFCMIGFGNPCLCVVEVEWKWLDSREFTWFEWVNINKLIRFGYKANGLLVICTIKGFPY